MGLEVREKQEKMEKVARPSSKDSIVVISADARTKAYLRVSISVLGGIPVICCLLRDLYARNLMKISF